MLDRLFAPLTADIAEAHADGDQLSVRELLAKIGSEPAIVCGLLIAVPILCWLVGFGHQRGVKSPRHYAYAILVYLACVPGMGTAVVTGYSLLFSGENLLDKNVFVYYLPILTMTASLVLIGKKADFDKIPGFDRLRGLMIVIALTFVILLVLIKTRIWGVFGGSIYFLIAAGIFVFGLLKWAGHLMTRSKGEERRERPTWTGE